MSDGEGITLNGSEQVLLFLAHKAKGQTHNSGQQQYSSSELSEAGLIRENWSADEINQKGLGSDGVVTSFDDAAKKAETELEVDAPFAEGVQKWQLPISLHGFRVIMTRFPPGTKVKEHSHPTVPGFARCGQLRVVIVGSITFDGKKYEAGDWFYIPNGVPYSFETDPDVETLENYYYQWNGVQEEPLRFSSFNMGL